jgi:hypothetical protein
MFDPEDLRIAQALIRAGVTARRKSEGDSEGVEADQRLADMICERLEAMITPDE